METRGTIDSLEGFYEQYRNLIYGYIYRSTGNHDVADDLTQETFYQACKTIYRFQNASSVKTWLYGIAKNVLCNYYRKSVRIRTIPMDDTQFHDNALTPLDVYIQKWRSDLVVKTLSKLDQRYSTVLILREMEGLSYEEISSIMKINVSTLRSICHRAKLRFVREYLIMEAQSDE